MKRQRWKSGDFVKIPLTNGTHCYGWIIRRGLIEFLDLNTKDAMDISILKTLPKLFTLCVMHAVLSLSKDGWPIIGHEPRDDENENYYFFMQDPVNRKLSIYSSDDSAYQIIPATYEECEKLERFAVWSACHVEDRLIAHYGGQPRFPVSLMRPIRVLN